MSSLSQESVLANVNIGSFNRSSVSILWVVYPRSLNILYYSFIVAEPIVHVIYEFYMLRIDIIRSVLEFRDTEIVLAPSARECQIRWTLEHIRNSTFVSDIGHEM